MLNTPDTGLIRYVPNSEMVKQEEEDRKKAAEDTQASPTITSLSAYLKTCLEASKRAKKPIEARLAECERRRKGEYSPEKLVKIREQGGSEIYMMLSDVKCTAFESWVIDIMFPPGDKPWAIEPTPIPDLPDQIEQQIEQQVTAEAQQAMIMTGGMIDPSMVQSRMKELEDKTKHRIKDEADKCAKRQELAIDDVLVEGGWYQAVRDDFVSHLATYPTAFVEGPIIRKRMVRIWQGDAPGFEEKFVRTYDAVSAWDFFPSPGMKKPDDGYFFIRYNLTRYQLNEMVGVPGYDGESIRLVLDRYGKEGVKDEGASSEKSQNSTPTTKEPRSENESEFLDPQGNIEAYKFRGSVQGKLLREWGMEDTEVPDELEEYEIEAWLIGQYVIKCILNEHPLRHRYLYHSSFRRDPESIWGRAVSEVMASSQDMCNAAARALSNNMAMSSGPMIEWNIERNAPDQEVTQPHPWMLIQTVNDPSGGNSPAVRYDQPESNANVLQSVYDYFFQQASEETGIPNYIYGQSADMGGAGSTATGLSMLMNSANRGLKRCIRSIDAGIVEPSIAETHYHLLDYGDTPYQYAGDIHIKARASDYLIQLEQLQVRISEAMNILGGNPVFVQIMGQKGMSYLLREYLRLMKIDGDKAVPDDSEVIQQEMMQKLMLILQAVSKQFNIPIELMLQAVTNQGQPGGAPGQVPNQVLPEKNPAGQSMGGRDVAQFNRFQVGSAQ